MRASLVILLFFTSILNLFSQDRIIYDLDSYKRVDIDFRTTFFMPDVDLYYNNTINNPALVKNYRISLGGKYTDAQLINDERNQLTKLHRLENGISSGTNKTAEMIYNYQKDRRSYNNGNYFKSGFNIQSSMAYTNNSNIFSRFSQLLNVEYDVGFGFGRLEIVNNAWIGARILEELDSKSLLKSLPIAADMRSFFDLIGDLEFDRVRDVRLKSIYQIEEIIAFIEQKEWIEKGSIKAFVTIYDAFQYEDFFIRMSGERLEFTLTPMVTGSYVWSNNSIFGMEEYIQPGYEGSIEYEIHTNGDLEYYQTKILGGTIAHFQRFSKEQQIDSKTIAADLYFQYQYRYIPSLRTNLSFNSSFSGGFVYSNAYNARIAINSSLTYNYYFSPSTQIVLMGGVFYNDNMFQVGDYQPSITGFFSFDVIHAIR